MNNRILPDRWLRAIGISFLSAFSLLSDDVLTLPLTGRVLVHILLNVASIAVIWHLNRGIIAYFRTTLRGRMKALKRLTITALACIPANTLASSLFDVLHTWTDGGTLTDFLAREGRFKLSFGSSAVDMSAFGLDLFHAFFVTVFFLVLYELLFFRQDSSQYKERLEKAEQEKEMLRVANMQSQLDVLKQQVNPHFLFNSLNSLSSLISEDPKQAEQFVDKLSGVYRYVLRANEQHLATLETELHFIDSYYHLLQTRYGAGLSLTVSVDDAYRGSQLPPLTLQLLVENAVKHNIVSPRRPLIIRIEVDQQGQLVVQNTLQRKGTRVLSNGVGLTNIVAKYQMLNLPHPSIEESSDQFTVRLPLLAATQPTVIS